MARSKTPIADKPADAGTTEAPLVQSLGSIESIAIASIDVGPNVRTGMIGPEAETGAMILQVDVALSELAASIAERGVLQPIKVRDTGDGRYLLLWGQRRFYAAQIAGLVRIPAIVETGETRGVDVIDQLVENVHREDLNPIDRARGIQAIVDAGLSQVEAAKLLGIAPSTLSNELRLLKLDESVQAKVAHGEISVSHAKAIVSLPEKQQVQIVERVLSSEKIGKPITSKELENNIEWRGNEAKAEEAAAAATERQLPRAIEKLAAVDQSVPLLVTGSRYDLDVAKISKAIAKAGWNVVPGLYNRAYGKLPEKCDCTATEITLGKRAIKIERICVDDRHIERQRSVDSKAAQAERKAGEDLQARITTAVRAQLATLPTPILAVLASSYMEPAASLLDKPADYLLKRIHVSTRIDNPTDATAEALVAAIEAAAGITPPAPIELPGPTTAATGAETAEPTDTPEPTAPARRGRSRKATEAPAETAAE